jgi:hypothetical protein
MKSSSLLTLVSPRTSSLALKAFLAIACGYLLANSVIAIIRPLWKYTDYAYYYTKVLPDHKCRPCVTLVGEVTQDGAAANNHGQDTRQQPTSSQCIAFQ